MYVIETKTSKTTTPSTQRSRPRASLVPPPVWRPESSSLTRAELRQIVLDTLG